MGFEASPSVHRMALDLGFDAVGVAEAGALPETVRFDRWLANGCAADMHWIEASAEKRRDVRRVLPQAESVIVLARSYHHPRPQPPATGTRGRVSSYAWGRDYHKVLAGLLRKLVRRLDAQWPGHRWYWTVDSGPVQERAWAAQAGVGWIGKNSLVLTRTFGSWIFLSAVLTTLRLPPDPPARDLCGHCRRCIDACPTAAIVSPGEVDSRRCIAYHTIENRGEIPAGLARGFGDWIFGCDICQEVCPWNRAVPTSNEPDFAPRHEHAWPELDAVATMEPSTFDTEFRGTPIRRAKLSGLQRNARIAKENAALARTTNPA